MNAKKVAIVGSGLIVAGIGLSAVGAALVLPALVSFTAKTLEKASDRLLAEVERASSVVGTVAGTLQRSMTEAARAGATEIRRSRTGSGSDAL